MKKYLGLFITMVTLCMSTSSFCQDTNEEYATINFYRVKESMMSGGTGLTVKIFINDKEVCELLTNTKLSYKLHSIGSAKIKCIAEFSGSGIGAPYVETFNFEKGKEYHIGISAGSMTGVNGESLNEKKLKKIAKHKFSDTIEQEESIS